MVVAKTGRIVLNEEATVHVSEGATWIHAGHLNVLAEQTAKVHLDGSMNWKPEGKMWVGSSAQCEWTLGDLGYSRFDAEVTWSGNGHVSMEGGHGGFLAQGQLAIHVSVQFQDMLWTGLDGNHEQMQKNHEEVMGAVTQAPASRAFPCDHAVVRTKLERGGLTSTHLLRLHRAANLSPP